MRKILNLTAYGLKAASLQQACIVETAASNIPRALRGSLAESSQQNVTQGCLLIFRSFAASSAFSSAARLGTAEIAGSSTEQLSLPALIKLYKQLSKHRLSALVVSTAAAGYIAGMLWNSASDCVSSSCCKTQEQCQECTVQTFPWLIL